ncbi:MAG: mannonate dehydratase [Thermomicrobiales bacterium]|nr:mannonate dehydratase [Thermomicrobiales bacterium]
MTWSLTIADMLPAQRSIMWQLAKQAGVTTAVVSLPEGPDDPPVWEFETLLRLKQDFAGDGIDLQVIESAPAVLMEPIKQGTDRFDWALDRFCELIDNMGRAGISVMCHNFMAGLGWLRTSMALPDRGGALVTGYDHELMERGGPTEFGEISEGDLWERMEIFLKRVVPVAENAGVKLAVHPDDPPLSPIRGIGRILTSPDNLQRVIDLVPSPNNGITFCQGSISTMGVDMPREIRRFSGQNKVFFIHFRDVDGNPRKFRETFHDEGQTDMFETMRAWRDCGFTGPFRVDHVPTMAGEANLSPGYDVMGRLYAIGYAKGLMEGVNKM